MTAAKKYLQSLRYSFYLIFHPFKGFWNLKHDEKMGTLASANTIVLLLFAVMTLRRQVTGFILNYNEISEMNIIIQFCSVVLPFVLWCVSNWCITTLVDGEGKFIDIYIASAYALVPVVIINVPLLIMSNLITIDEIAFYNFFDTVSLVWTVFLFLVGIMTVHQFTMPKTIGTILVALLGMVIIVFLFVLFFALIQQLINFIILLVKEVQML